MSQIAEVGAPDLPFGPEMARAEIDRLQGSVGRFSRHDLIPGEDFRAMTTTAEREGNNFKV